MEMEMCWYVLEGVYVEKTYVPIETSKMCEGYMLVCAVDVQGIQSGR